MIIHPTYTGVGRGAGRSLSSVLMAGAVRNLSPTSWQIAQPIARPALPLRATDFAAQQKLFH